MTTLGSYVDLDVANAEDLNDVARIIVFSPTWTGVNVGNGSSVGQFWQIQDLAFVTVTLEFGSTTSLTGPVTVSFPEYVVADIANRGGLNGQVMFEDSDGTDYYGVTVANSTTVFGVEVVNTSSSYASTTALSGTVPFTWDVGDHMVISLWYGTPAITTISTAYDGVAIGLEPQVYIPFTRSPDATIPDTSVPTPFLWWDASETSTLVVDGSGYVSSWRSKTDTEGVGDKDLVQSISTRQPQSGTRTLNGLNVIDFDGVDDAITSSSIISLTPPFQIFAVLKSDVIVTNTTYDYFYDGKESTNRLIFYLNTNVYSWNSSSGNNSNTQTQTLNPFLHASKVSEEAVDGWARFNGITDMYAGPTTQWDGVTLGCRYNATGNLNGLVAEFMVYDRVLTDQEYWNVTNYLNQKWLKPEQPVLTAITPSSGESVTLSLDVPLSSYPIIDYKVQYSTDGSNWLTFDDGVNTYTNVTVTGLTNGTLYYFRVAGVNQKGIGEYSSVVTATPASSPSFSPLDLSPVLWLDASDTSTINQTNNSVYQWDDLSGNGNHVVQATAANQPTTGIRTINSLNVLDFDGSDNMSATFGSVVTQPNVVFIVGELDVLGLSQMFFDGLSDIDRQFFGSLNSNRSFRMSAGTIVTGGTHELGAYIYTLVFDGASTTADRNNINLISANAGTNGLAGVFLGATYANTVNLNGSIAEFIIVEGTLTATEIAETEAYLANKWGITL